ncbi:MAG TPA: DUF6288 domain-containing protein [Planctomycetota bacterium]
MIAAILWAPIKDKDNQGRWEKRVESGPDAEVPGFLVNLGPTGARAALTEKTFVVRYVFKGSPAYERLRLGDVVSGAFGKPFAAHTFGGSPHGYEGPIMDFGDAIERAEAKDGKLVLNVVRGAETIEVAIPLEAIGAFSPTFPTNCRKSELLRARALKYLAAHPEGHGGPAHARAAVALAFLAAGDDTGKRLALAWNQVPAPGTWTWGVSYQLITLCEYHLLTQDPAVLPTIKALVDLLRQDQYDGRILVWGPGAVQGDYARIDASQQLYLGGFGHAPYQAGAGKNGYGPMQYTTILPVIAWQLAAAAGVKVDPKGVANALDFIHRGTNEAGYVAYGGEFTLNNGYVDPVAWKKSTSGMNYVGRAGASLLAHKLSGDAASFEKNKSYMKRAYKSLPDGHACSVLGFLWGLMGAAAAEDEALLRATFDYHKAWFNMMRCHDGSFVVQPGRDYADGGYYLSSRYNPTAVMAIALGLGDPRLQIQGIQVSIPGVNPKALKGPALAAYKAIVAKKYGEAARLLEAGDPMAGWLDGRARRVIDTLSPLEKAGRWLDLKDRLGELKKSYAGLALFDQAAAAWEVAMRPHLAGDKLLSEGQYAKALAAAPALEGRIRAAVAEVVARWTTLRDAGRWHALKKDVDLHRERVKGLADPIDVDPLLVEGDRLLEEGAYGPALAATALLDTEPAKALRARALEGARRTREALDVLDREGRWHTLRLELAKARPKLAGLIEERAKEWEAAFNTPSGRAWIEAERLYLKGDLGAAARGAAPEVLRRINEEARTRLKPLLELEAKGDWYGLERELAALRKKLAGAPAFDEKDVAWQAAFKVEPAKTGLRLGAAFSRLRTRKEIEAFIQQAGDTYYGREARELLTK